MTALDNLIDQIPLRHDLISYLVFSGVLTGFLLALVIWVRAPISNQALKYYALLLCCLSIVTLDTLLCYTGWMKYVLAWNDSTEPLTLLLAPLLYLSIRFLIVRRPLPLWIVALHFLPAILYALSQTGYYFEPLSVKYNAYKGAYFADLPYADVPEGTRYGYQGIKDLQRWFLLLGFAFYGTLSIRLWYSRRKSFGDPAGNVHISRYRFVRLVLVAFVVILSILLLVYLNYDDDRGDHYITLFTSVFMQAGAVAFLMESRFFQHSWLIDKYETASGPDKSPDLEAVRAFVSQESFFCSETPSLKKVAEAFGTHPNAISRLINQQTGGNFNDFVNGFRIRLAIERLGSADYKNWTIEGVGQSVGFRSKSSFYQAFRKQTGMSPAAYLKSVQEPY
ncbi:helix-turn-helix domain-containing protein [Robiginitalea marina]|uniref:Helix-turn-helix domain-containing protein n=1 Tax=Robiginitalea marina TaxID=2954105 RepID=A0ABT1AYB5_9FLAO|nr:helix-turn-helix domain-containing protein [Robiginitalea marina]MCO5724595.1 helix-turn-helix domain-containing protein [Robiginitalea marina]